MVEIFKKLHSVMRTMGYTKAVRLMTDMSGEQYWTVVAEQEVESLEEYLETTRKTMTDPDIKAVMKGYHTLVESGRREIYQIEQ